MGRFTKNGRPWQLNFTVASISYSELHALAHLGGELLCRKVNPKWMGLRAVSLREVLAEYNRTILKDPALFEARQFAVRVRLSWFGLRRKVEFGPAIA